MADLDTALKRASGLSVSLPWRAPGKYPPSVTFGAVERASTIFLYGGIASGLTTITGTLAYTNVDDTATADGTADSGLIGRKYPRRGRTRNRYAQDVAITDIPKEIEEVSAEKQQIEEEIAIARSEIVFQRTLVDNGVNRTKSISKLEAKVAKLEADLIQAADEEEFLMLVCYAVKELV